MWGGGGSLGGTSLSSQMADKQPQWGLTVTFDLLLTISQVLKIISKKIIFFLEKGREVEWSFASVSILPKAQCDSWEAAHFFSMTRWEERVWWLPKWLAGNASETWTATLALFRPREKEAKGRGLPNSFYLAKGLFGSVETKLVLLRGTKHQ